MLPDKLALLATKHVHTPDLRLRRMRISLPILYISSRPVTASARVAVSTIQSARIVENPFG